MAPISDVMTPAPYTVMPGEPIDSVRSSLRDIGVHCLPVANSDGHPVGIVTTMDLVDDYEADEPVRVAMSTGVRAVGVGSDTSEAASIMCEENIHHLVVTDDAAQIVGVVSSLDLLRLFSGN